MSEAVSETGQRLTWGEQRRYAQNRRCSMGVRCRTYHQTAMFGKGEVGKIRSFRPAHESGGRRLILCNLCENARIEQDADVEKFVGVPKMKGRNTSYELPNLLLYRSRSGLSQERLAKEAGLWRSSVFKIEHGERATGTVATKLAKALGVSVGELRGEA